MVSDDGVEVLTTTPFIEECLARPRTADREEAAMTTDESPGRSRSSFRFAAARRRGGAVSPAPARRRSRRHAQLGAEGDRADRPVGRGGAPHLGVRLRARARSCSGTRRSRTKGEEEARAVCSRDLGAAARRSSGTAARRLHAGRATSRPTASRSSSASPEILARTGRTAEEELVFWNRAFTAHDHEMWQVLEHRYGAREGADRVLPRLGADRAHASSTPSSRRSASTEIRTTEDLAKMNRAYWEAIGCEVEEVETTPDRHVAIIKTCPFWDNMIDMYGKDGGERDAPEDDRRRRRRTTTRRS